MWLDLFCGCGGFGIGLKELGIESIGVDNNPDMLALHDRNVGKSINADINEIDFKQFLGVEGIHASPPCQAWSLARTKTEPRSDAEIGLRIVEAIEVLKPKYFTLENVPGYSKSESLKAIYQCLLDNDYFFISHIANMSNYGIPQSRSRLFIGAIKNDLAPYYLSSSCQISWYMAIRDLIDDLEPSELTTKQKQAIEGIKEPVIISRKYTTYSDDKFSIALSNEPCWTILAGITTDGKGANRNKFIDVVVDGVSRSLNIQCLARLQSFPDSYIWSGKTGIDGHGIGNSVPPKFAKLFVENLIGAK